VVMNARDFTFVCHNTAAPVTNGDVPRGLQDNRPEKWQRGSLIVYSGQGT
jgi:hypothetical protein